MSANASGVLRHPSMRFLRIAAIRGSATGLQFLSQVAVSRLLGPIALGTLALTQSSVLLFGTIGSAGLPWLALRKSALGHDGAPPTERLEWISGAWLVSLVTGLVAAIAACAQSYFVGGNHFTPVLLPIIFGTISYSTAKVYIETLKGYGKQDLSTALEFIFPPAAAVLGALIAHLTSLHSTLLPAVGYVLAFLIVFAVSSSTALGLSFGVARRGIRHYFDHVPELLSICAVQVSNQVVYSAPVIILAQLGGLQKAGAFGIMTRLVGMTSTFSGIIATHYTHAIIKAHRAENWNALKHIYLRSLILNGAASAAILLPLALAPQFFLGLFGPHFADARTAKALTLLAGLMLVRQMTGLNELHLTLTGHSKLDALSQAVSILVMVCIIALKPDSVFYYALAFSVAGLTRGVMSGMFSYYNFLRFRD